jgi:hypothetical protein
MTFVKYLTILHKKSNLWTRQYENKSKKGDERKRRKNVFGNQQMLWLRQGE